LNITGSVTPQPFVKDNIICLYNGEIYNHGDFGHYSSDGECLIDLYLKYGNKFVKELDGEFSIILLDFNENIMVMSVDPFKTKPLFYSIDHMDFGCSTYKTPLLLLGHVNVKKMKPNNTIIFRLPNMIIIDEFTTCEFDLDQHKNTFEDWSEAFKNSILKRTSNLTKKLFIGLSSGYDSGVICSELINHNKQFTAYTMMGKTENKDVLNERHDILKNYKNADLKLLYKSNADREIQRDLIRRQSESFK